MARRPRIELEGGLYHVIVRGNDRQDIFHGDEDHEKFLSLLAKVKSKLGFYVYAYCLMTNHIHLLIERRSETVGRTMQRLLTGYSQYYNRRYHKIGHLFQGRHKSILCQSDPYLAKLIRYVHLNPVRAQMVYSPDQYPYCSHRAYLGIEPAGVVDIDPVLRRFGPIKKRAHERYAVFMLEGAKNAEEDVSRYYVDTELSDDKEFDDASIHLMGEVDKWASKHKIQLEFNAELLLASIEEIFEMSRENFFGSGKNSLIITAKEVFIVIGRESGATVTELSKLLSIDTSNTSRRCDSAKRKLGTDKEFADLKVQVEKNYRKRIAESQNRRPDPGISRDFF